METAKVIEKSKVAEITAGAVPRKAEKRQNSSKLIRAKHCIDAALNNLGEFGDLKTELSAIREKVWARFLELER